MVQTFSAQLEKFGLETEESMRRVFLASVQDTMEVMTRRVDGVTRGAAFKEGFVPVDTGELINSFRVRYDGADVGAGPAAYEIVEGGAATLDTAIDAAFTADHARRIEYGFSGEDSLGRSYNQPGRFFVRAAVNVWDVVVEQNALIEKSGK